MTDIRIKRLSKGIFQEAFDHNMAVVTGVLQYLDKSIQRNNNRDVLMINLSDGFTKTDFVLNPRIERQFEDTVKPRDIIDVEFFLYSYRDTNQLCLEKFNIIYPDVLTVIGEPISFVPHLRNFRNDKGSSEIPLHFVERPARFEPAVLNEFPRPVISIDNDRGELLRKREQVEIVEPQYNMISELAAPDKSWLIKARVLNKQELRPFRKNQGEYFSVILSDRSGKIRATFFKSMATKYYPILKEGGIYTFTGGEVERASTYNNTNSRYEIIFKENVLVEEQKDTRGVPNEEYSFVTIAEAFRRPENNIVDLLAIVKDPGELEIKELKRGGTKDLRRITLIDQGERPIEINVWGDIARKIMLERNEIYIFKNLKLKIFNDQKYFLWENFSKIFHDELPGKNFEELVSLAEKYKQQAAFPERRVPVAFNFENTQPAPFVCLSELNNQCGEFFSKEGNLTKRLFFEFTGFIESISRSIWYEACGFKGCKKKVQRIDTGFYCDKCRIELPEPQLRFMADVKLVDGIDFVFGRIFGEENCVNLFGKTVAELRAIRIENEESYIRMLKEIEKGEFYFKVIAKLNLYQGEERLSLEILNVVPTEKISEGLVSRLLENLTTMKQD